MVKYHPDTRFLTDYAAGSLPQAQALCVATHLHYCAACKLRLRELTALGAELFLQQTPLAVADTGFERLLKRVENAAQSSTSGIAAADQVAHQSGLPKPLHKLARGNLDNLKWRTIGRSFRYSNLKVEPQRVTTLIQIKAGGSVPHHRHKGDEITVVIKGSFSDYEDKYSPGDFIVRTVGERHQPVASQDGDCLCLITLDAPIVMSNWFYRVLQRML
jgi:putative transcriptional regulator